MKNKFIKYIKSFWILLAVIILLGLVLRADNYTTWPRQGATFDEYAWTWQGINLIQKGAPISWSPHEQYQNANSIIYQQTHFRIVNPFLEHPPVFGLVAGSFAMLNGASSMYDLELHQIRPLALIMGVISIVLIALFVKELYGKNLALLTALLYATIPSVVVGSRIVQNENFFIPVWLLILLFAAKYIHDKKIRYRNFAIALCMILVLAKIPWIAASISLIGIFLYYKKYKDAVLVFLGAIFSLIIFGIYGYIYDWNLFINLWKLQTARYDLTFNSIYALFQKPFLVDRHYTDGWIYFGWFAFILLLTQNIKKNIFVIAPFIAYFLIFLAGIPDEAGHGWYRYPFYPFLIISIALFLKEYFVKNLILTFMFLVFIGTSLLGLTWEVVFGYSFYVFRIAIISWLVVLLPIFPIFNKFGFVSKRISYVWLICFFFMNIWASLIYNEQ